MKIFKGQRFFVYGGGVSGKSASRAVTRRGGKVSLSRDNSDGEFVAPPDHDYRAAIISPGIRHDHAVYAYCKERGISVMGEAELGFRLADCPIVGVTGTNGKTTVTRLIASMLGGTACGNIGYPITTAVDTEHKALVCELSSFQLKDAHISPNVAVITNIATDHIDWHGSAEDYYSSKCNIASDMTGSLVLGEDITVGALKSLSTSARIVRCSTTGAVDGAYIEDKYFKFFGERVCPVEYLRLPGKHNIKNALCAVAAAKCMGADNIDILKAMSTATPDLHRLAVVGKACGKTWIDDSKATNVSACLAAVESLSDQELCLLVGGRDKALDFDELFCALPKNVVEIIAMGESAESIRKSAEKLYFGKFCVVDKLAAAVDKAAKSEANTVLLSPCCASFDEFGSYAERGDKFKARVSALRGKR